MPKKLKLEGKLVKHTSPVRKTNKPSAYNKGRTYKIDGLPIKNLTKSISLEVSAADCRVGKTKAPSSCAAALAATRQIPGCTEARVHVNRIYLKIGKHWLRGRAPQSLRQEIVSFDRGGKFHPGLYTIDPLCPSETAALGQRAGGADKPNYKKDKSGARRPPHYVLGVRSRASRELGL